jgi:UPF0755 protein
LARPDQPRSSHERSAEERERARQERALRRAQADPAADPDDLADDEADVGPVQQPPPGNGERADRTARGGRTRLRRSAPARRRSARARVAAVAALALTAGAVWFLVSLFQPFAGAGSGSVIVVIPKGSSASRIGSILARDGVVPSGFFFELRALLEGKRGDLHSGRFRLRHNMSYGAAIDALSAPPPAVIAVTVVIPEGFTRLQIARLAEQDALSGSYLQVSTRSALLNPARYGAPRGSGLEGFLFPATYQLSAGDPASRLVAQQLAAFQARFDPALVSRARALGLSAYQLLTVASMIEREAKIARDRPLIAAVIYNRLRLGMPLGIDATVYYALALREGVRAYERELTASDLRIESPYNTRAHAGLPPSPIANPGLASIEAAARPARVPYLYYVAAPDGCGEHVFSSTAAQFESDVAAYQAALRRNGGHLPACTKK